jgi:signal transduction protein with GAF and PtsI domain
MERASLYSENVKRLEEQRTLYSISQEIASRLEVDVILQKLIQSATQVLEAEAGVIVLWNQRRQNYTVTIVHGLPENIVGKVVDFLSGCVAGEILRKKSPVLWLRTPVD